MRDDSSHEVPTRRSPLHHQLEQQGAQFELTSGWLQPRWFRHPEQPLDAETDRQASREGAIRIEQHATRHHVGVFDSSSLSKVMIQGPDALASMEWLSTAACDVPVGKIVYTTWCDDQGGVSAHVTVTRLADDRFLVVGTDTVQHLIVEAMHQAAVEKELDFVVNDVTSSSAVISVQGPDSRKLITRLTEADLSNKLFPYMSAQTIDVHGISVLAMRVTFTGELGWELHVPTEFSEFVYRALFEAAGELTVVPCGYVALHALGAEKGYLDFDHTLETAMTPLEANIGFTISWTKTSDFRGRRALERQQNSWPPQLRLALVQLADPTDRLILGETVLRFGIAVGRVVMAAYGHTINAAVGYVELTHADGISDDWIMTGDWTIRSIDKQFPQRNAHVGLRPWYDPHRLRLLDNGLVGLSTAPTATIAQP
jgi:heterotetrameric sarcosine oxidase gamma subunit